MDFSKLKDIEIKDLLNLIRYEIQQTQRPAIEIILDDEDVMKRLKISKRKLQYLKSGRTIPFHTIESGGTRTYYLLSDILDLLKSNRIETVQQTLKFK
jgi:hypothetical protein